jgi:hypothetical protein
MDKYNIPIPVSGRSVDIQRRVLTTVDCPNPKCDQILDITNINAGTMVSCASCNNVTWVPAFKEKWWQRLPVAVGGAIVSIFVGAAGSLLASGIWSLQEIDDGPVLEPPSLIDTE